MPHLDRSELIRLMVLLEISDDYENVDQIIFPNVARDCSKLGLVIDRLEIVAALSSLVESGLAAAYLLGKKTIKVEGMPEVEVEDETEDRRFKTYFYCTRKGLEGKIWEVPWWPFDDERNVLPQPEIGLSGLRTSHATSGPHRDRVEAARPSHKESPMATTQIQIAPGVTDFLARPRKMLINNQWVESVSGKTFPVYNPANGEQIAQVAEGDAKDIDLAVKAARAAFETGPWHRMTASDRGRLLWKLGDLIDAHVDEFAQLESLDNGKPLTVARAADVPLASELFRYMAGWTTKLEGNTIPLSVPYTPGAQYHAFTQREPVGVVGQIIPWNFPLLMAAWKLGPALAAGCTVILKPAEQTPLSALRLGELILQAGFPAGVVNIVPGYGEAGAALAAHPDVDKVAFTGSTEVGKLVLQAAAGNLKKVSLELGGKSPNVILADADLSTAIDGAASAIFFNQGQCCCAGSRLYIEHSIFDQVVEGVADRAKKIRVRPGMDPECDMGPLVSQEQFDRVCGYLESGIAEGATAVTGGRRSGTQGYFVEPTIMVNASHTAKVVQEEIFGPVVTATPFHNLEEVLPRANDTMYGLAAGIWTSNISKAHKLANELRAGTVWINCYNIFDAALPFGGYKQSGWGREMGHDAVEMYTEKKAVCVRL